MKRVINLMKMVALSGVVVLGSCRAVKRWNWGGACGIRARDVKPVRRFLEEDLDSEERRFP